MKKISICLLSGLLLLSSCLDEDPKYTTNEGIVYSSEQSAQMALNGIYGLMTVQGSFAQLLPEINTEAAGICWTSFNPSDNRNQYVNGIIPVDNEFNNLVWGAVYQAIANCNIFIDVCQSDRSGDWANKANMVAQAKFLRGVCYYQLFTFYGGVPLRLEPTTKENLETPRASRQQIIDQIVKDWTEAAVDLADNIETGSGKPTAPCKASAYAYLAKLYWLLGCNAWAADSYEAPEQDILLGYNPTNPVSLDGSDSWANNELRNSWPEMRSSEEYFREAKRYGDMVFANNPFGLEPDFKTLFNGQRVQASPEFIFVLDATGNTSDQVGYNSLNWTFSPQNSTPGESWGRAQPNKSFYNWAHGTYMNDPRLDATFMSSWDKYVNNAPSGEIQYAYPIAKKTFKDTIGWKDTVKVPGRPPVKVPIVKDSIILSTIDYSKLTNPCNPDTTELDSLFKANFCRTKGPADWNINDWGYFAKYFTLNVTGRYADNNLYIYRYADFLLLMADVENELGNMSVAEGYVNQVLDRARNSTGGDGVWPKAVSGMSTNELRTYIFNERLFELVAEYDGFIDTRRRGINWRRMILERNNMDNITRTCYEYGVDHGYSAQWREYWYPNDETEDWNTYLVRNQQIPIPRNEMTTNNMITTADQNPGY